METRETAQGKVPHDPSQQAPFPLTPALSPRRGSPSVLPSAAVHPLPSGEGRGEGEGTLQKTEMRQRPFFLSEFAFFASLRRVDDSRLKTPLESVVPAMSAMPLLETKELE